MDTINDVSSTEMENFLTRRLGEKESAEIMTYINQQIDKKVSAKVDTTSKEISMWRDEMSKSFASKADAATLQQKLVKRVSGAESTLILWAFVFWITQLIAVICFLKFFK